MWQHLHRLCVCVQWYRLLLRWWERCVHTERRVVHRLLLLLLRRLLHGRG